MKITFINPTNNKEYELIDHQEVVSIGDAKLKIEIEDKDNKLFDFSIEFKTDTVKTNPYRKFNLIYDKLTITLFNFYNGLGAFFPDIVDLDNGYSLHVSSSYIKENNIRRTQIFYYSSTVN